MCSNSSEGCVFLVVYSVVYFSKKMCSLGVTLRGRQGTAESLSRCWEQKKHGGSEGPAMVSSF